MRLTNKLLGFLHRVFDKKPAQFLALRLSHAGSGMNWQVADGVLTTAPKDAILTPEVQRNLLANSEQIVGWNSNGDSGWIGNYGTAPDGKTTSTLAKVGGTRYTGGTVTAGTTYTYSLFGKAGTANAMVLYVDGAPGPHSINCDLVTGAMSGPGDVLSYHAVSYPNGWWRFDMQYVAAASGSQACHVYPLGSAGQTIEAWGAQLERDAIANVYTATAGSPAIYAAVPTQGLTVPLRGYTVAQLVGYLAGQPGYSVLYVDGSANAQLSAAVLIDGAGDTATSNGDNLLGYTSFVWTYLEAQAIELAAAEEQGQQALQQMNVITASDEWLDELGGYFGVGRLALPVPNLISPSNSFDVAPWNTSNILSRSQTTVAGPLGLPFTKLVPNTTSGAHYVIIDPAVDVSANTGTASVFAAAAGYGFLRLQFRLRDPTIFVWIFCNLATGAITSPSTTTAGAVAPTSSSAELVDGVWRFSVTAPLGTGASPPRVYLQAASASGTSTFAGDGVSGIYIAGAQFEASGTRTPYIAGGTTYPEDDAQYSPRMIAEILRPRGNNVAIEAAIKQFTGQDATVEDVTLYGQASPNFDALVSYNGAKQYNAQPALILGLFDVRYSYDLLSGSDITIFRKTLRDLINKMRDAGTQLRSLLLTGSAMSDAFPNAPIDGADTADLGLATAYTATDAVTAPTDATATILATVMANLPDTVTAPTDTDGGVERYLTSYSGLRTHNGIVSYLGGEFIISPAPALDLDLTAGALDNRIAFSRASSATRINAQGLVELIAADVPRFDYDPLTRSALGLLIEEARTNYLANSVNFSGWVGQVDCTVTANATTAPDGTNTAFLFTPRLAGNATDATAPGGNRLFMEGTYGGNGAYANSIFVKSSGAATKAAIYVLDCASDTVRAKYEITTTNQWQRISAAGSVGGGNAGCRILFSATNACYIWGAQVELVPQFLGGELVTNGAFVQDTTGWAPLNAATIANVAGELQVTTTAAGNNGAQQTISGLTVGKKYTLAVVGRRGTTAASITADISGFFNPNSSTSTTNAALGYTFVATATSHILQLYISPAAASGETAYFDNISVKETAGVELLGAWQTAAYWAVAGATFPGSTIEFAVNQDRITRTGLLTKGKQYTITVTRSGAAPLSIDDDGIGAGNAATISYGVISNTQTITFTATSDRLRLMQAGTGTISISGLTVRDTQNLVLNGEFTSDASNWTAASGASLSVVSGRIRVTNSTVNGQATQTINGLTAGRTYQVSALVDKQTSGNATLQLSSPSTYKDNSGAAGTVSITFVAASTSTQVQLQCSSSVNGAYSDFDNVTLTDVTELVSNGSFEGMTTGWTQGPSYPSLASCAAGELQVTALVDYGAQLMPITCVVGRTYAVSATIRRVSGGGNGYLEIAASNGVGIIAVNGTTVSSTTATTVTGNFVATATAHYLALRVAFTTNVFGFDNISVKELIGAGSATSYIPTTSAPVTRAADAATMADVSWRNTAEGTMFAELDVSSPRPDGFAQVATLDDGTGNEMMALRLGMPHAPGYAGGGVDFLVIDGGAVQVDTGQFVLTMNALQRMAYAYRLNDFSFAFGGTVGMDGNPTLLDTSGTLPTVTRLVLANAGFCGHIRRLTYAGRRLADSELKTLTMV